MEMAATSGHFHERRGASQNKRRWAPMRCSPPLMFVLLAACTAEPKMFEPAEDPLRPANPSSQLLHAHNRERAAVGAPPLSWDQGLASAAAAYAAQLAALGSLRHSARKERPGQGENLWMGTRAAFLPQAMVANWASERSRFRPGIFPAVSRTGHWADVGHYSQMIWPTTTRLGCAIASSRRTDFFV